MGRTIFCVCVCVTQQGQVRSPLIHCGREGGRNEEDENVIHKATLAPLNSIAATNVNIVGIALLWRHTCTHHHS